MNTLSLMLPLGFHEWMPATQALTLGLLTFVQEDLPTVGGALLAASGALPWLAAFLGCFLGIWLGDALLYLVARGVGRPLLSKPWSRRFFDPAGVARSEEWFARQGTWLLVSSRFVPGTRLPTYLAAGFLRLPFSRFLLVSGIAVGMWTIAIFSLARAIGPDLVIWLRRFDANGFLLLAAVLVGVVLMRLAMKLGLASVRRRIATAWERWTRWEFWPAWLFYAPVAANYLRLALKHRGFTLPTAANPGIFSGGLVGESKIATLQQLSETSPEFTAEAALVPAGEFLERLAAVREAAERCAAGILPAVPSFSAGANPKEKMDVPAECRNHADAALPFILKPDVGQRGVGVKLIRSWAQAEDYLRRTSTPLIVQRYAPGPCEAGVFYYRFPGEARGRIFAVTEKIFPSVTGDGASTIEELIWRDDRARFMAAKYLSRFAERRSIVPARGEVVKLVEAGNHAQGCIFRDGAHLWSEELERRLDEISQRLDGFFIGRYDLRFGSADDLREGRNFQIIELNGAASEATSIYDARNSLRSAYRTLFRQWELVFAIGAANRRRGASLTPLAALWRGWRAGVASAATLPGAD